MIVRLIGGFQQPVKGYGKLASCAECTVLQHCQGADPIYEIVIWNVRVMLCKGHLRSLGLAIPVAIETQP